MKIKAAVAREARADLVMETLDLEEPRAEEILVEVVATGVCHTDIVVRDGMLPTPLPVVLGHEGAGIVRSTGSAVTKVKAGDRVVMTFNSCGYCETCKEHQPAYCYEFFPRNFLQPGLTVRRPCRRKASGCMAISLVSPPLQAMPSAMKGMW